MNPAFDLLIAILAEAKTWGVAKQTGTVIGAFVFFFSSGPLIWKWMKERQSQLAKDAALLERDLTAARRAAAELREEIAGLAPLGPDAVLKALDSATLDGDVERKVAIATAFIEHQRNCSGAACRILAEHHLSRYEDGADALRLARTYARGALAAAPSDGDMALLLGEVEALLRVEAATPETQEEIREAEERERLQELLQQTPEDVDALFAVGCQERDAGRYRSALVVFQRADQAALADSLTWTAESRLSIQLQIGYALLRAGRVKLAHEHIIPLPPRCIESLGPDDPTTLEAKHLLALLRTGEGEYRKAERVLRELLPLQEKVKGIEHPDALATRRELARTILDQGRAAEAEGLFRELLPLQEKVIGVEHSGTLATRHELARAILNQGRAAEAEGLFRELLPLQEKVEGIEHPNTLTIRHALASAILRQGQAADAERLLRELLPLQEKVKGIEHPNTLATRRDLACAIFDQGQAADAERLLRELLPLQEKVIGIEHPGSLATRRELARSILDQGQAADAERLLRDLLPLQEKVIGIEHPGSLATRRELARSILDQGQAADAERLLRELLPLQEKVIGIEHPGSLTTRYELGRTILCQGRSPEAESLFRDLLPLQEKVKGIEHPGTLATRHALARAILDQGQAAEAESLFRELLPLQEKVVGIEHPFTLATRRELARTILDQGQAHTFSAVGRRPFAPVHLTARAVGGDVAIDWIRRTRIEGDPWPDDDGDVPIGETVERYRVEVREAGALVRGWTVTGATSTTYTAAQQAADAIAAPFTVRVQQVSETYGRGAPAEVEFTG